MEIKDIKKDEPKRKYQTPKAFRNKMMEYFDDKSNAPYLIQDLACYMGLSTDRFYKYGRYDGYQVLINYARQRVECNIAKKGLLNQYNPFMAQFVLKNMGWKDQMDINANTKVGVTFVDDIPRRRRE